MTEPRKFGKLNRSFFTVRLQHVRFGTVTKTVTYRITDELDAFPNVIERLEHHLTRLYGPLKVHTRGRPPNMTGVRRGR